MSVTRTQGERSWFSFDHRDMMVFILIMSLHGLQAMISELLPEFSLGGIGLEIGPFLFISMALVFLFRSFWGCLAIPVGGIVFSEILIGDFAILGAVEGLFMVTISYFIAVTMVTDPTNVKQIAGLAVFAELLEEGAAWLIDVGKFYVGVEELEAIAGLPETVWATEGVGMLIQVLFGGIIFGAIPLLWLYPRLRGKIEPLLGMEPLPGKKSGRMIDGTTMKAFAAYLVAAPLAFVAEAASESSTVFAFTPAYVEQHGQAFLFVPIGVAAFLAFAVLFYRSQKRAA